MTTMRTIVNDALETMGVIEMGKTPPNDVFTHGLGVLNDMLHGWRSRGVDIGHATLEAGEHVNLLSEHDEGVKMLLAVHPRMVKRHGAFSILPELKQEAKMAWNAIYAAYAAPNMAPANDGLSQMPSQRGRSALL